MKKLTASDAAAGDRFGTSVSISGGYAVVGAPWDNDYGSYSGSAYIFYTHQDGVNNWGQQAKLTASDAAASDVFGESVSISSDYALVGAPYDDDGGGSSGSAYIFHRNQGGTDNWGQVEKLTASDAAGSDEFGSSVSISGDYAVVGAWLDDDVSRDSGSAYIFQLSPTVSSPTATNITQTGATLGATVENDGISSITERGVVWSTNPSPTTFTNMGSATAAGTTGVFTVSATSLTPATTYHYRGYATNSVGTSYTADATFSISSVSAPTLSSPTATGITHNSATLGGTVDSDGGSTITERGVVWSTSPNPTTTTNEGSATAPGTTGTFTVSATSLSPVTTYHYRAYATNSVGTSYTVDDTFTTSIPNYPPETVSVSPASGSAQTFVATYSDANGSSDLKRVLFMVNSSLSGANSAFLLYRTGANKIHLRNNSGSAWSAGKVPGSAGTLSNSQVSIDVSGVNVSTSGTDLQLTLPLVFRSAFAGNKKVYMRANDQADATSGWNQAGTFNVTIPNAAPETVSVSPSSGSGASQTFVATYRDNNGASDLARVFLLIKKSLGGANSAYLLYRPSANKLHLRNDAGSGWGTGVIPGTSVVLQNSQVKVFVVNVITSTPGNQLKLTLPLRFKASFAGDKKVYMRANDQAGATSGWNQMGIWTATSSPAPPSYSSEALDFSDRDALAGETQLFSVDAPPDTEVQWLIDGLRLIGREVLHTFEDAGLYDIELWIKDREGASEYSANPFSVEEHLLWASDLQTLTEEKALVTATGRAKAKHLLESIEEPVIIRLRGKMVPGLRLAFNRIGPRNYQFIELRETEDLEGWVWCFGEVVNGEETLLADRTMKSRSRSLTLALELDTETGEVIARLNGRKLFEEPIYSDLHGGVSLLPPETRTGLDITISRPVR